MGVGAPDSYQLVSAQGSQYELASYIRAEDGPDFGDAWMAAHYAENPAADGAQFAYESIGIRTMSFPIQVPSNPSGIDYRIQQLTLAARPGGAYLELAPFGATSPVRFDIAGPGRWKPDYHIREQAISIRRGTLELDVQPFGYLPTDIILASTASVALPGQLALDTTKLIGDGLGLGKLTAFPTMASSFGAPAAQGVAEDFFAWSLAGAPSFSAFWGPASLISSQTSATLVGDGYAPASQALRIYDTGPLGWDTEAWLSISPGLAPAYRGRFRVYSYLRLTPSQPPRYFSADSPGYASAIPINSQPLASAQPVATLYSAMASPAYTLLDLGELSLPQDASGLTQAVAVRLWDNAPSSNGIATTTTLIGGIYLQPLSGAAGVLPRGLAFPNTAPLVRAGGLHLDAYTERVHITPLSGDTASVPVLAPAAHIGVLPLIGASSTRLDLCGAARKDGATYFARREGPEFAAVSLTYRPQFGFARGI